MNTLPKAADVIGVAENVSPAANQANSIKATCSQNHPCQELRHAASSRRGATPEREEPSDPITLGGKKVAALGASHVNCTSIVTLYWSTIVSHLEFPNRILGLSLIQTAILRYRKTHADRGCTIYKQLQLQFRSTALIR
jgi:hypothetical protein